MQKILISFLNVLFSGLPVVLPDEAESVLLGGAILAKAASDCEKTTDASEAIVQAMSDLGGKGKVVWPNQVTKRYESSLFIVRLSYHNIRGLKSLFYFPDTMKESSRFLKKCLRIS